MKKALKENYENILILEDDTTFLDDLTIDKIINRYSKFLDKTEYGIFYLAGNSAQAGIKHIVKEVYLTFGTLTTGSYLINKRPSYSSKMMVSDTYGHNYIRNGFY